MRRKKIMVSDKIRQYLAAHPDATAAEVSKALNVSAARVYAVKYYDSKKAAETNSVIPEKKEDDPYVEAFMKASVEAIVSPADPVNQPAHYTDGGIETIDFLQAKLSHDEFIGYLKGNVIKYGSRLGKKDDANIDAGKMAWYAARLRDFLTA